MHRSVQLCTEGFVKLYAYIERMARFFHFCAVCAVCAGFYAPYIFISKSV
jgi:hypothetical protein